MNTQDRTQLIELMGCNAQIFRDAVKEIDERYASRRPSPERWSALECAEHVANVEGLLLLRVQSATHSDESSVGPSREADIVKLAANRDNRFEAPEPTRPIGRYSRLDQAVSVFLTNREKTVQFINNCELDLRAQMTTHPRLGVANSYEILLMMAMHPKRHAAQIREIGIQLASTDPTTSV